MQTRCSCQNRVRQVNRFRRPCRVHCVPESSAESSKGAELRSSRNCSATASVAHLWDWAGGAPALQFLLRMRFDSPPDFDPHRRAGTLELVPPVAREKEIGLNAKRWSPSSPGRPCTNREIPNTRLIGIKNIVFKDPRHRAGPPAPAAVGKIGGQIYLRVFFSGSRLAEAPGA